MKKAVLGLAALGLVFSGAVAAFAASPAKGSIPRLQSPGVEFAGGHYKLNRPGVNHGAFEWWGRLSDTIVTDRHNVYVEVKVQGHDWVRYYGKQRSSVQLHRSEWNGAQRYIALAELRACRDRGSLRPDNCARLQTFTHDWDRG
ncbi:hypothetical protein GCM10010269_48580 [Streptomyces humidus]|uniref:Uncharacterized protein n=1 Tax=Streptomyces humidus TaxID=52259 RepID=A0A918L4S4_9ACTN|nr:hypothetical protein [Streptomyces humidus]GGS04030.1 hypothetical protein GCM10010269_48580 [Streptomyces humidus]